jgi:hypothetical protein
MPSLAIFGISAALSFVAWGLLAALYVWPTLRKQPRVRALRPLLLLHSFRFVGLAFLVPGVVSPNLPAGFAHSAAYGDFIASLLALFALAALNSRFGVLITWVFNLWGTADLVYAFYLGIIGVRLEPGDLGAAYFIPTVLVPLLLIAHALVFRLLLQGDVTASRDANRAA